MDYRKQLQCSSEILSKAIDLGATLVGICDIADLKNAPSFTMAPKMPQAEVGSRESDLGLAPGEVYWPEEAKSAVIIAYGHPEERAELDWWYGKIDPPGNRAMAKINKELSSWIEETLAIKTFPLPYHVEKGGIFLKDAAYYAGLGCIGRNNILVTPLYGPRVRLRAMLLSERLPSTGPSSFNPCPDCDAPCLNACPQKAFAEIIYSPEKDGQENLPGLTGNYSRDLCNNQMTKDNEVAGEEFHPEISEKPVKIVKYCRKCETSCPVGLK